METVQPGAGTPPSCWPLFLAGVLLFLAGPAIYFIRFRMQILDMPEYVPILAAAGVFCMGVSVFQRWGIARVVLLVLFLAACGFEWFMVLVGTKTPPYSGPARPGHKVPSFATTLADGTAFTDKDLETGSPTVMVFFRGRW